MCAYPPWSHNKTKHTFAISLFCYLALVFLMQWGLYSVIKFNARLGKVFVMYMIESMEMAI